ncbi:MAG: Crp/Fnr family transcriptional regulator [Nitrosospira sp.]
MTSLTMSPERACVLLSGIKEFQGLDCTELQPVAQFCHWHRYSAGQEIIRYRDQTTDAFFIVQGAVRVTYYSPEGQEVILCDLSAGEMFGELTAIDGQARSAQVIVRTDSIVASMPSAAFLDLLQTHPNICLAMLKRLSGEVRRLTERVYDFSTLTVRHRIHAELLRLARLRTITSNIAILSPAPTHVDIANRLSTHREAVTRELNELARKKLVLRKDHELHILDVAKLTKMVEEVRDSGS